MDNMVPWLSNLRTRRQRHWRKSKADDALARNGVETSRTFWIDSVQTKSTDVNPTRLNLLQYAHAEKAKRVHCTILRDNLHPLIRTGSYDVAVVIRTSEMVNNRYYCAGTFPRDLKSVTLSDKLPESKLIPFDIDEPLIQVWWRGFSGDLDDSFQLTIKPVSTEEAPKLMCRSSWANTAKETYTEYLDSFQEERFRDRQELDLTPDTKIIATARWEDIEGEDVCVLEVDCMIMQPEHGASNPQATEALTSDRSIDYQIPSVLPVNASNTPS